LLSARVLLVMEGAMVRVARGSATTAKLVTRRYRALSMSLDAILDKPPRCWPRWSGAKWSGRRSRWKKSGGVHTVSRAVLSVGVTPNPKPELDEWRSVKPVAPPTPPPPPSSNANAGKEAE
jgi:hypothetical protein